MLHRLTSTLLVLGLLACATDDPTAPADPNADLSSVAIDTDRGVPLSPIAITGLTADPWEYQVEVVDDDGTVRSGAPVFTNQDGDYYFPVPFHADDPAEGGLTQLRITQGEAASELLPFTIDPLPASTSGMPGLVTRMRTNLARRAELLDTSVNEIASASWASLDPIHVPLKLAWSFLDDPENENRLSELAEGRAPLLGEGDLDIDLLNRVLDLVDAGGFYDADNQALNDLGTPPGKTFVEIGSPEQLDWYMGMARSSAFRLEEGSAVHQFHQDLGLLMTAVGIIPHPAAQLTAAGVGAVQFAYNTSRQAMANLLPSSFTRMEFTLSHPFFNEDSEAIGEWSQVDIWAVSKGWNADQAVVDGLLVLASLGRAHGDWMNRFESITGTAWATNVRNFIVDTNLRMLNAIGQNGVLTFDPETFGPIDITGMPWSQGYVLTDKISIISDKNYKPIAVGEDELEIRTAEGKFGGAYFELSKPVEVRGLYVEVTPTVSQLENPGEVVTLQATVHNADNKELEWTIAPATWQLELAGVGSGTEIGSILTPSNPDLFDFQVTVVSKANTGLLASGPPRMGAADIKLGDRTIVIDPGFVCIDNDDTVTFTAEIEGLEDQSVTWHLEQGWGSIGASSGVYRSPNTGVGEATIVATSVEDPELTGWATVSFGTCKCWWNANIWGDSTWKCGGPGAAFTRVEPAGEDFATMSFLFVNPDAPGGADKESGISFNISYTGPGTYPWEGDTGTYRISGAFFTGSVAYFAAEEDADPEDPGPFLYMEITESTSSAIAAKVTGQMMRVDQNGFRSFIGVNMEFRAAPSFDQSSCYE